MTTVRAATAMAALEAMDRAGLEYAVVRNHEQIPVDPGRDIDLLAERATLPEVEAILAQVRSEFGWQSLLRCRGHHEGTSYYFIGERQGSKRPDQLEIHFTRIRWAGATILGPGDLIARRVRADSGIWIAAPEHTVVQRVCQIGFSNGLGQMREEYWDELQNLTSDHFEATAEALGHVIGDESLARTCVEALSQGDRSAVQELSSRLRRGFLLAGAGTRRLPDLPGMAAAAVRKTLGERYPARCGVVVRVDPPTPDEQVRRLVDALDHMFVEVRNGDLAELGRDRLLSEAADVVSRAGLMVVRAPEPFDASFRWLPKVSCWIPPGTADGGIDLVVRRFCANHHFVV